MATPHSSSTNKATFLKHLPFESATNLSDAKYIATDRAEAHRYKYRATAVLAGNAGVKVGQLIYLDNLSQGMSGYWTVLKADHIFGSGNAAYQLEVLLGTDKLNDVSTTMNKDYVNEFISGSRLNGTSTVMWQIDQKTGVNLFELTIVISV